MKHHSLCLIVFSCTLRVLVWIRMIYLCFWVICSLQMKKNHRLYITLSWFDGQLCCRSCSKNVFQLVPAKRSVGFCELVRILWYLCSMSAGDGIMNFDWKNMCFCVWLWQWTRQRKSKSTRNHRARERWSAMTPEKWTQVRVRMVFVCLGAYDCAA